MQSKMIPLTIANTLNQAAKQRVDVKQDQTVRQAVVASGLGLNGQFDVFNEHGEVISNNHVSDFQDRTVYVGAQRVAGGAWPRRASKTEPFEAVVPNEIVEQTRWFTAPRGRLEMGGLLFGHVDASGRNVIVCGFFPKQTQATSGYCEFDGGWTALASSLADRVNEGGAEYIPQIRVLGWIHTHPDIGIFLSATDITTFGTMRAHSGDGRVVAVVVDPLRKEHGVFIDEHRGSEHEAGEANGTVHLGVELEKRYLRLLKGLHRLQRSRGRDELPFILSGMLRNSAIAEGLPDDVRLAMEDQVHENFITRGTMKRELQRELKQHGERVTALGVDARRNLSDLERRTKDGLLQVERQQSELRRDLEKAAELQLKSLEVSVSEVKTALSERIDAITEEVGLAEQRNAGGIVSRSEATDRRVDQLRQEMNSGFEELFDLIHALNLRMDEFASPQRPSALSESTSESIVTPDEGLTEPVVEKASEETSGSGDIQPPQDPPQDGANSSSIARLPESDRSSATEA